MGAALPRAMTMAACAWGQTHIRAKNWGAFLRRLGTEPKANTTFAALAAAKQRAKASGQRGSNEPGESVSTTAS